MQYNDNAITLITIQLYNVISQGLGLNQKVLELKNY